VPSKTQAAEQKVGIADLFSKCEEIAAQEESEIKRIMGTMLPLLSWLKEPVVLRPASLGEEFAGYRSVSLQKGATVVTTDFRGKVTSRPMTKFHARECLAILQDAFPELQRMVVDKRRGSEVRPALSIKATLSGPRFLVDMRTFHLVMFNAGGDCRGLTVRVMLPGDKVKAFKPCDLSKGERIELDLGVEVARLKRLAVELECKDVDSRDLRADVPIRLDSSAWEEVSMVRKQP
jgi:hypothetical protein